MPDTTIDTLHPAVTAADYTLAAVGETGADVVLRALRADELTPAEAKLVEPLAAGLAYLLGVEVPPHQGRAATVSVGAADVSGHVSRRLRRRGRLGGIVGQR